MLLAHYPLLDAFWTMLIFFALLLLLLLLISILVDNFARHDHSGWAKAGWTVLVIFLPLIGILIYLIVRPSTADVPLWNKT